MEREISVRKSLSCFVHMRGSRKFCQRGSNTNNVSFCFVFLVDGMERRSKLSLNVGHHWPANDTSLKWRFAGVSILAQH